MSALATACYSHVVSPDFEIAKSNKQRYLHSQMKSQKYLKGKVVIYGEWVVDSLV